ncbi:MAG: hypothetical protein COA79_03710 [Planctomycetota bacterium]|nr:MAG: hypothetical protein COA79_03710 [Planctomycetota bacterium]
MAKSLFISIRFLFTKKINLMLMLLISICLACLITVDSVAHGFSFKTAKQSNEIFSDITIDYPYKILGISDYKKLIEVCMKVEGVKVAAPFVEGNVFYQNSSDVDCNGIVYGIDWNNEVKVSAISKSLMNDVKAPECFERNLQRGALFGNANQIGVGNLISLINRNGSITIEVNGYIKTGVVELDSMGIFVSLDTAQSLFGASDYSKAEYSKMASGIRIKIKENYRISDVQEALRSVLNHNKISGSFPVLRIRSYRDVNHIEITAMESYEKIIKIILFMMVIMITFAIFIPVQSMVQEKKNDIGILKALGASRAFLFKVFLFIGFILGTCSTIVGVPLGLFFANNLNFILDTINFQPFPPEVFYDVDELPIVFHIGSIILIILFVNIVAILASVLPAYKAARYNPLEIFRQQ